MKKVNSLLIATLFALVGCDGDKQAVDDLISVDVTANYPKKELVLQDFMDVEYIPLETNDEFVCGNYVRAVGRHYIIVTNRDNDGNIYIFDRSGKALRKINRKGQGGEEYSRSSRIVLDENNDEIFINDMYAKQVLVYDLEGNFRRKLSLNGDFLFYEMYNFDRDNLICRDAFNDSSTRAFHTGQSFMLISKLDGSITEKIQIPFKEKKSIVIKSYDETSGIYYAYMPQTSHPIMPYLNDYVLTEHSADTLYRYSQDHTIKAFIVRSPSIQSMNPEKYLLLSLLADRYYFMEVVEKTLSFSPTDIVYDKQEKALFRYKVYNSDYTYKKEAFLKSRPLNGEIPSCQYLEAWELIQDYKSGRLKGRLKEIASQLNEDSNPVIMLIKHKK
ncbi:MAG: 6-bladed beta-propeller [Parabacteroides sp.]|nr:6-bladed beta-propeller [Parabacteroides sp.]